MFFLGTLFVAITLTVLSCVIHSCQLLLPRLWLLLKSVISRTYVTQSMSYVVFIKLVLLLSCSIIKCYYLGHILAHSLLVCTSLHRVIIPKVLCLVYIRSLFLNLLLTFPLICLIITKNIIYFIILLIDQQ